MILIGRYMSPFVRRVAVTLKLYDIAYEHRAFSTMGDDRSAIRDANPVTRVPALILDDGETLVDSAAILDHLDEVVGPQRALTPAAGAPRRRVLKLTAIAVGAAEKAVLTVYEQRFRPEEKWHEPWVDMVSEQARSGFRWLDAELQGEWLAGEQMTQADITTATAYEFVRSANADLFGTLQCPRIDALSARLAKLKAFGSTAPE